MREYSLTYLRRDTCDGILHEISDLGDVYLLTIALTDMIQFNYDQCLNSFLKICFRYGEYNPHIKLKIKLEN